MKDTPDELRRIPKEQLTAYERWELPLLDASGNEIPREEERDVRPLTAADLSAIRDAAREEGFREGRDAGYQEGLAQGRDSGHEEGLQTGLAEGREQGRKQGYEEARTAIDSKLERLEQVMAELLLPIRRQEDELETALVNLTTVLARTVVFRELTIDSSQIHKVVRKALAALPSTADNIRIRINPEDCELVREAAARLDTQVSIVEDEEILPGGCKVETRQSLVDFTVEKRFQRTVQKMLDQQLDDGSDGESGELDSVMEDLTDFHLDVLDSPASDSGTESADEHPVEGDGNDLTAG